jgi:hypothetical protein
MKLTESHLRGVVKQELRKVIEEAQMEPPMSPLAQSYVDRLEEIYAEMLAKASSGELTANDFNYGVLPDEIRRNISTASRKFKNSQLSPEVKAARAAKAAATRAANKQETERHYAQIDARNAAEKAEKDRRAAEGYAPLELSVGEAYGSPEGKVPNPMFYVPDPDSMGYSWTLRPKYRNTKNLGPLWVTRGSSPAFGLD